MSFTPEQLGEYVATEQASAVLGVSVAYGELELITNAGHLLALLTFLRDDVRCQFRQCVDVTAIDYPSRPERFELVYLLLSHRTNQRVRVKILASEDVPVPTVTTLYPSAGWCEREVWDMYGVFFAGHPDLRRILTDYGFDGHPQRKDFPLSGFVELRYDEAQKRVVYEPVKLTQAFRQFDFLSPWEGPNYPLPGDEKAGAK